MTTERSGHAYEPFFGKTTLLTAAALLAFTSVVVLATEQSQPLQSVSVQDPKTRPADQAFSARVH